MADAKKTKNKAALKEAQKEAKRQRRAARRARWAQIWTVFKEVSKRDKTLIPAMLAAFIGIGLIGFLVGLLFNLQWFLLVLGLIIGATVAMYIFSRKAERMVYAQADGQPGAAAWAVENLRSGVGMVWRAKAGVSSNIHMDAVHRVVGLCGIVLVAEGDMSRVRPLVTQQKKRLARITDAPIYEVYTGSGPDQVPISKLQRHLMKLPRNLSKDQVYSLADRLESVETTPTMGNMQGMPKGPLPNKAKLSGMNRRMRRANERKGR